MVNNIDSRTSGSASVSGRSLAQSTGSLKRGTSQGRNAVQVTSPTFHSNPQAREKWKKVNTMTKRLVGKEQENPFEKALSHFREFKKEYDPKSNKTAETQLNNYLAKKKKVDHQILAERYRLEALDPLHRYGKVLYLHWRVWRPLKGRGNFFKWLDDGLQLDRSDLPRLFSNGKINELYRRIWQEQIEKKRITKSFENWKEEICQISKVQYLNESERLDYVIKVEEGRLFYQNGSPVNTNEHGLIFVWGYDDTLYAGPYKRGSFHHSSFFSGRKVKAAGEIFCQDGKLVKITDQCGHYYSPHPLKNLIQMWNFLEFLHSLNIDLKEVDLDLNAHPQTTYNLITWDADTYRKLQLPLTRQKLARRQPLVKNLMNKDPFPVLYLGRASLNDAKKIFESSKRTLSVMRHIEKKEEDGKGSWYHVFRPTHKDTVESLYFGMKQLKEFGMKQLKEMPTTGSGVRDSQALQSTSGQTRK